MDTRACLGAGDARVTALRFYSVYGERLASDLPLPELDEIPAGPARWTASVATTLPPMEGAVELGAECIYGDVHARLIRHAHGHRIVVEDTGTFDLSEDRTRITIVPLTGAWDDFVRAHLMGRVLATALHLDGLLPLHGSAVATAEGVIGFLAPKGYGKSSLALALTTAGAWLVSDDTLAIDVESGMAGRARPARARGCARGRRRPGGPVPHARRQAPHHRVRAGARLRAPDCARRALSPRADRSRRRGRRPRPHAAAPGRSVSSRT